MNIVFTHTVLCYYMQLIRRIQIYTDTGAIGCPKNQNKDDLPLAILYGNAIRSCLDRKYLIQILTYIYIYYIQTVYLYIILALSMFVDWRAAVIH